jgi:hypothetical protein
MSVPWSIIQTDINSNPLESCLVWVATDAQGSNVIAGPTATDETGTATFYLDTATLYAFRSLDGYNFSNPQTFTVT